ncbi:hypothetical protein [Enterococcus mundtii]|uniref:hypothetical protein n=1 Tax=Enterococcus TaxID=1350 RepID=UPI00032E0AB1|nr:hypothetical protein [Enterococcus mundtii]EOH58832.1 hypothetical protein UAC_02971 [Enterococcus mundtii ATCC 882]EOU13665.1 hypothetical protein I587_02219 [Enterococcus mundtii ATCC 882]MDV7743621.1 hypothetical protein [Enterococcus mundtii]
MNKSDVIIVGFMLAMLVTITHFNLLFGVIYSICLFLINWLDVSNQKQKRHDRRQA